MTLVDSVTLVDIVATLDRSHFAAPVLDVARDLIGRTLIVASDGIAMKAIMVETEAYAGVDDPASHAAFRPGGRAAVMSGEPGTVYVYAAYGMYPCLNIVAAPLGTPSAVLVRGVWIDRAQRPVLGPGRTGRVLGVTLLDHGSSIEDGRIRVAAARVDVDIVATPRIGIRRGVELPWRFVDRRAERGRR